MQGLQQKYKDKIYAGVLGKIIGVYLGRPVEGWKYEEIIERFGQIQNYVHEDLGVALVVADDDISGTFGFFRAMEDNGYKRDLSAAEIGQTWLNYIIEDKSVLWWGGLGNSTEHTAYLNLKKGIPAPRSGSIAQNGATLAEQIGAQIFMDAYAMMCPGDPEMAAKLVKEAASVSHDGVAVEAACYLGAMEALAFDVSDLNRLFDDCLKFVSSDDLRKVIFDVRDICSRQSDWRLVREFLDEHYGYHKFKGPCHMIPNHSMVLASLLTGGDDFQKSISIAASAAWDTDCNAANVGCLNGIRLGIDAIDSGIDYRSPVADRILVVTSDGGEGVTDAVRESRKIITAAAAIRNEDPGISDKKFSFEFKGSTQGFRACPYHLDDRYPHLTIGNLNERSAANGLEIGLKSLAEGVAAHISAPVFIDYTEMSLNYDTFASPLLYSSQVVKVNVEGFYEQNPLIRMYIVYYDNFNKSHNLYSEPFEVCKGVNALEWRIPDVQGLPIVKLGFAFTSKQQFNGKVGILDIDWRGAPEKFEQKGVLVGDIWELNPFWFKQFVSSARHFTPTVNHTYTMSHPEGNGVATIGTHDFADYAIASHLSFSLHKKGGLVLRSKGHRRYYGAMFSEGRKLEVVMRRDDEVVVLAQAEFDYVLDEKYYVQFVCAGNRLSVTVNGLELIDCVDPDHTYSCGGTGFVVDAGTIYVDDVYINRVNG